MKTVEVTIEVPEPPEGMEWVVEDISVHEYCVKPTIRAVPKPRTAADVVEDMEVGTVFRYDDSVHEKTKSHRIECVGCDGFDLPNDFCGSEEDIEILWTPKG